MGGFYVKTMTLQTPLKKSPAAWWKAQMKQAKKMWPLYVFLILPVVFTIIFNYIPIGGLLIAFKDYKPSMGILESPWNDFKHFKNLFASAGFWNAFRNTLFISLLKIGLGFPASIILALQFNEIRHQRFKKFGQAVSYLPTFMSWVVLSSIFYDLFAVDHGVVSQVIQSITGQTIDLYTSGPWFIAMLVFTHIWQSVGWNSVVYLAALSSVNPEIYEAADIDGAGRFKKAMCISLPSIMPVIVIVFILGLNSVMNAGYEQILSFYNPLVMKYSDIIDTYVYRMGIQEAQYAFSTAVGLFKNVISVILVFGTNAIVRRFSDNGIF